MFQLMNAQITFKNVNKPDQSSDEFLLPDSLFDIPNSYIVNPADASSIFSHFGLFDYEYAASEINDSFNDEVISIGNNEEIPTSYHEEVQKAIDDSLITYASYVAPNDEDDLVKALQISILEDEQRRKDDQIEHDEINRILELSKYEN